MSEFDVAIAQCAAGLALKMAVLHYMTLRTRFQTGNFTSGRQGLLKEDTEIVAPVLFTLKLFFCAYGPVLSTVERWTGCIRNANENEPYFMILALAFARSGLTIPSWAPTATYLYLAGRIAHAFVYTIIQDRLPQPTRGSGWTIAFAIMIAMALAVLAQQA
mmetsp:Transcript_11835/g.16058  ORF Transcript_11835/g.16058 Transcript_11835/m.16058 type:complete len:161 (-) Transcript_11835:273-755(-)|eukprot:CAMPEP_0197290656 /NCGR_PEP_ID=MMETSP0890-20130614/8669_1 /TAXON_ID=44058 ORGANISM="Aureoumbra lagunensis, Strain CCMP1510" /NCGR_SAMPLE_ID=MMETSP0890 /ASSEMBLY_ACC=CAM_ASM_000533 /LENGTH=160 /DNA_ID=CAMNT_0042762793 /DNA_START=68 /DNA_END=550 /DNA_ORIENTATION=+